MSSSPLVVLDAVSFAHGDAPPLLQDLSLGLHRERTGLVGRNGSGKTTLLRLVTGELRPRTGTIHRLGRIGYLPQSPVHAATATVADMLGVAGRLAALVRIEAGSVDPADYEAVGADWDLAEQAVAALESAGLGHLPLDRPLTGLSGGEITRGTLAGLMLAAPELLVLDEPTNNLDAASRAALHAMIGRWTGGMLVVSHDRELLRRMDRIVELSALGVRSYGGNYDLYAARRAAEEEAAGHALADAQKNMAATRRAAQAARERQAKRDGRGKRDRATANQSKLLLNCAKARSEATGAALSALAAKQEDQARAELDAARTRVERLEKLNLQLSSTGLVPSRRVLTVQDLVYTHPGATRPVFDGLSFTLTGPRRIALVGPNGSGKSTLLKLVSGRLAPQAGRIQRGVERIAWLDQHAGDLRPDWTVLDNFRAASPDMDETDRRTALARFLFRNEAALQRIDVLSGGQRLRAALACALNGIAPPQLLLLDEPTNHLDLDGIAAIEGALRDYDGALIVASHDPDFLDALGIEDRIELTR